jgi:hypothetical protein
MSIPTRSPTLQQQNTSILSDIGVSFSSNVEAAAEIVDGISSNVTAIVDTAGQVAEPLVELTLSNSAFLRAVAENAFLAIASVGEKFPFAGPVVQALKGLYEVYQVCHCVSCCHAVTPLSACARRCNTDGSSAEEACGCV